MGEICVREKKAAHYEINKIDLEKIEKKPNIYLKSMTRLFHFSVGKGLTIQRE